MLIFQDLTIMNATFNAGAIEYLSRSNVLAFFHSIPVPIKLITLHTSNLTWIISQNWHVSEKCSEHVYIIKEWPLIFSFTGHFRILLNWQSVSTNWLSCLLGWLYSELMLTVFLRMLYATDKLTNISSIHITGYSFWDCTF